MMSQSHSLPPPHPNTTPISIVQQEAEARACLSVCLPRAEGSPESSTPFPIGTFPKHAHFLTSGRSSDPASDARSIVNWRLISRVFRQVSGYMPSRNMEAAVCVFGKQGVTACLAGWSAPQCVRTGAISLHDRTLKMPR